MDTLHRMAEALLERETLNSKDIDEIMGPLKKAPPSAEEAPQADHTV